MESSSLAETAEVSTSTALPRYQRFFQCFFLGIGIAFAGLGIFSAILLPLSLAGILVALGVTVLIGFALSRRAFRYFPLILFFVSLFTYIGVCVAVGNPPIQDFLYQYDASRAFMQGDSEAFMYPYFIEHPYQTSWSLVMAALLLIWDSIGVIKLFLCLCSSCMLVLLFYLAAQASNQKIAQCMTVLLAVLPTFSLMNGALSNQVLSALLCLLGVFILFAKVKWVQRIPRWVAFILAGVLLACSNFIRPDAAVVVIALIIAMFLLPPSQTTSSDRWLERLPSVLRRIIVPLIFAVTYGLCSSFLSASLGLVGIDASYYSSETTAYRVALGTNYESSGMWSAEVIERLDQKQAEGMTYKDAAWEIVAENIQSPQHNVEMFVRRTQALWWGESVFFMLLNQNAEQTDVYRWVSDSDRGMVFLLYALILVGSIAGIRSRESMGNPVMTACLVFIGTCLVYQFIEVQPRYAYLCTLFLVIYGSWCIQQLQRFKRPIARSNNDR